MPRKKTITKITTKEVVRLTGRSPGRLSQLRDELPALTERAACRGGGRLYDRALVLAWAKANPVDKTKQKAGRARYSGQGQDAR